MEQISLIIQCKACGGKVSIAAIRCPHCGHPGWREAEAMRRIDEQRWREQKKEQEREQEREKERANIAAGLCECGGFWRNKDVEVTYGFKQSVKKWVTKCSKCGMTKGSK